LHCRGRQAAVRIDTGGAPFKIKAETLNEDVPASRKPLRLGIALTTPIQTASVTLTITPEPNTAKARRTP
jgi:hypothetical protein